VAVLVQGRGRRSQTSPFRTPKVADHGPQAFSPANRPLPGDHDGAMMAIADPLWPRPLRPTGRGGTGRPSPVVAVLPAATKRQTSPLLPPKDANRGPPAAFTLQNALFWGPHSGPSSRLGPRACLLRLGGDPCPRCGSTSRACQKRQTSPLLPQRTRSRSPRAFS
jgi:hypothetical protein